MYSNIGPVFQLVCTQGYLSRSRLMVGCSHKAVVLVQLQTPGPKEEVEP